MFASVPLLFRPLYAANCLSLFMFQWPLTFFTPCLPPLCPPFIPALCLFKAWLVWIAMPTRTGT